jgi:hypothetical protein
LTEIDSIIRLRTAKPGAAWIESGRVVDFDRTSRASERSQYCVNQRRTMSTGSEERFLGRGRHQEMWLN